MFSSKKNYLRRTIHLALLTGAASALALSAPVVAQDQDQDEALEEVVLEEVIVTGSRIRRADFDMVTAAVVIDSEFIEARGFTNVADALNEAPAFGIPGNSPTGGQGAADVGQNFVNFFGLGSSRTLTLVNGRRFVASNSPTNFNNAAPGLQVDLNVIPTSLVERVESVAIIGSPIYGSDAIAGTVNVILRSDFEGAEYDGSYGISAEGDLEETSFKSLFGGNFANDRGNAVVSVEYNKREGLLQTERDFTNQSLSFQAPNDPDSPYGRVLIDNARVLFATWGGQPSLFFGNVIYGVPISGGVPDQIMHFAPDGTLIPFDRGVQHGNIFSSGGDGVHLAALSSLLTPSERFLINGLGHYEFADGIEGYVETFFANTTAHDNISQAVWQTDFFSGSSGAIQQNTDNPFLTGQAAGLIRDECANYGALVDGECDFLIARSSRDIALGQNESELNMFRIVTGLRGSFDIGDRYYDWDVSYNFGRTNSTASSDGVDDRRMSFALDPIAFSQESIDALDGGGLYNIVRNGSVMMGVIGTDLLVGDIGCSVLFEDRIPDGTNISLPEGSEQFDIDNCVPMSVFGEGAVTPEARAYVNIPYNSSTAIQQKVFQGNIGGNLFKLPAGEFQANIGFETRRESSEFDPDYAYQRGGGRSAAFVPVSGGYDTREYYGEFLAPLVDESMLGFVADLSLEGAIRYVDNSRSGSDNTWTIGGSFTPNFLEQGLTLRGNVTSSIRSPAVTELFLPTADIFTRANDPCDGAFIDSSEQPTRRANCEAHVASLGLPSSILDGFSSDVVNGTVQGTLVGNPNLENEEADSLVIGIVYSPSYVPGLRLAVDYVDIEITNAISLLGGTQVMEACYDSAAYGDDVCNQISRNPITFQVTFLETGYTNAGFQNFRAVPVSLDYSFDINELFSNGNSYWGDIVLQGQYMHTLKNEISITGSSINDQNGEVGRSRNRGQLNIQYFNGDFDFLWQTRYVGSAIANNNDDEFSRDVKGVPNYWLHNVAASYQFTENMRLRLNVNNVFDTREPYAAGAYTNGPLTYDFIGRYYKIGLNMKF